VLPNDYFDIAFFSNYLEHLPSTEAVLQQLRVTHAILKPGGSVVILQPNIRLIGGAYWDFIDHQTALTEKSLAEAAVMAGFRTKEVIARFLPYTTKSRIPQHAAARARVPQLSSRLAGAGQTDPVYRGEARPGLTKVSPTHAAIKSRS